MILKDSEIDTIGLFDYFDNLDESKFDIPGMYQTVVLSLVESLQKDEFKFQLPLNDNEIWIHLEKRENILKSLEYIINHFYRFEIYELIKDFLEIKEFYEKDI
jgi:hypothetical protein